MTNIKSDPTTVDSLCAMVIEVLPSWADSSAFWTIASLSVSNADVASSNSKIAGSLKIKSVKILKMC